MSTEGANPLAWLRNAPGSCDLSRDQKWLSFGPKETMEPMSQALNLCSAFSDGGSFSQHET